MTPWPHRWQALATAIRPIPDGAAETRLLEELKSLHRPRTLGFVNAHAMNMAATDLPFFEALAEADILLRDGVGTAFLYRRLHRQGGLNMNGTDFIPKILAAFRGRRVAFWGTREPFLTAAAERAEHEFGVRVVSRENGFRNIDHYLHLARTLSPDLILLGMGMPRQELLARELRAGAAGPALIVCGGAIIDFLGGKVSRAPAWMRRHGLEWAYRLWLEPGRLCKRYLIGNTLFLWRSLRLK